MHNAYTYITFASKCYDFSVQYADGVNEALRWKEL